MRTAHVLQRSVMIKCEFVLSNSNRQSWLAVDRVARSRRRDWSAELFADGPPRPASISDGNHRSCTQSRPTTHTHATMSAPARPLAALKSALRQLRADKHHSRCYATAAPSATPARPVDFHPGAIMTGRSTTHLLPQSFSLSC